MIAHIVCWKVKEEFNGAKKESLIQEFKEKLEALPALIDIIVDFQVGVNFTNTPAGCHLSLYSTFKTKEDLETYAVHPDHKKVVEFAGQIVIDRVVSDYEF